MEWPLSWESYIVFDQTKDNNWSIWKKYHCVLLLSSAVSWASILFDFLPLPPRVVNMYSIWTKCEHKIHKLTKFECVTSLTWHTSASACLFFFWKCVLLNCWFILQLTGKKLRLNVNNKFSILLTQSGLIVL